MTLLLKTTAVLKVIAEINRNKDEESQEEVVVSISKEDRKDQSSALLRALSLNPWEYEDSITYQLNREINIPLESKEGFEILEINHTDNSQICESEVNVPKTPTKYSQSDSKLHKIKHYDNVYFNNEEQTNKNDEFDMLDIKVNQYPIRKSRKRLEDKIDSNSSKNNDNIKKSLDISDLSDGDKTSNDKSWSELSATINISHTPSKNINWDDLNNRELRTFTNQSPDEDYEINEKDLDENYNNIYSNGRLQEIEDKNQEVVSQSTKNYYNYLRNSQYLSGITEQSVEESIMTQSYDNIQNKIDDNKSKPLLISKYSWSDDGVKKDSVAFLYDKFRDQLDRTPDSSIDIIGEYPATLSPFGTKNSKKQQEVASFTNKNQEDFEKSIKNINFNIQIESIRNDRKSDNSLSSQINSVDRKYSNFRKGDKGILTLEELIISEDSNTPSKENRIKRYDVKDIDDNSRITLSNISWQDGNIFSYFIVFSSLKQKQFI